MKDDLKKQRMKIMGRSALFAVLLVAILPVMGCPKGGDSTVDAAPKTGDGTVPTPIPPNPNAPKAGPGGGAPPPGPAAPAAPAAAQKVD